MRSPSSRADRRSHNVRAPYQRCHAARHADRAAGGLALTSIEPQRVEAQESQAAQVSGLVFEDRDGSGAPSAANPGLSGVLVSNGREVEVTGPDGRYTLPLPEEATVFVVKPAGFMPPG
jgi:hypothetical protein